MKGQQSFLLGCDRGAIFSPCRQYRYLLWRRWDAHRHPLLCLMLNPSTADETVNDPTVERCERRARRMGFGGVEVCNLFAFRATDPREMKAAADPVGPKNDCAILTAALAAGMILCAWGNHGSHRDRANQVEMMLREKGHQLHALRITGAGHPAHPLYMPNDLEPTPWLG